MCILAQCIYSAGKCSHIYMYVYNIVIILRLVCLLRAGGWNLLNMSNESSWDINDPLFLLEKLLGNPAFFTVGVTVDDKNSSNYIVVVCAVL